MNWRRIFQILGLIAALLTLLPLIAVDYWWIRVFDFPHLQLMAFTLLAIVLYLFTFSPRWINDYVYIIILLGCFAFQFSKVIRFTPFVDVELLDSSATVRKENQLLIYTANVLQENKEGDKLFEEIIERQPDLILFTETNDRWSDDINKKIGAQYAFKLEEPRNNTYGMILFSKFPLEDAQVKYLVDEEIPSIHAKVRMANGNLFQLYAIHPTPPMPQHNDRSTDRDTELMKVAIMSYNSQLPVILLGDFNDVAWSAGTELTKKVGKLLDLRIGRGFHNTYHAQYPLIKWPLDHILVSPEFRLTNSGTGVDFESDHYPTYAYLTYEPDIAKEQKPDEPSKEDWQQARSQMSKEGLESFTKLPAALDSLLDH